VLRSFLEATLRGFRKPLHAILASRVALETNAGTHIRSVGTLPADVHMHGYLPRSLHYQPMGW
jgi:hypothetical protein